MSESQLLEFLNLSSCPGTFKEPKSGKYIVANQACSGFLGLDSPDQMIGMTVRDFHFVQSKSGNAFATEVQKVDWLVQENKRAIQGISSVLSATGYMMYQTTVKVPILGLHGNVLGIITYGQELTQRLSHRSLYLLYKKVCGRQQAVNKLLCHLGIDAWFFALPTEAELYVLLERSTGKPNKAIAQQHGVSIRTVEAHITHLRGKLQGDVLALVIARLRERNELSPEEI